MVFNRTSLSLYIYIYIYICIFAAEDNIICPMLFVFSSFSTSNRQEKYFWKKKKVFECFKRFSIFFKGIDIF